MMTMIWTAISTIVGVVGVTGTGVYTIYAKIDSLDEKIERMRKRNELISNVVLSLAKVNDNINYNKVKDTLSRDGLTSDLFISPEAFIDNDDNN